MTLRNTSNAIHAFQKGREVQIPPIAYHLNFKGYPQICPTVDRDHNCVNRRQAQRSI